MAHEIQSSGIVRVQYSVRVRANGSGPRARRGSRPGIRLSARTRGGFFGIGLALGLLLSLAIFHYPTVIRAASEYDHICRADLQTQARAGCSYAPAVVLREWATTRGRSSWWNITLALQNGRVETLDIPSGNLRGHFTAGSRLSVQFWQGRIALVQQGPWQARTWNNPDWKLENATCGVIVCTLLFALVLAGMMQGLAPWWVGRTRAHR